MVDRKSGPVKPPVIDATARTRDETKPDASKTKPDPVVPASAEKPAAPDKTDAPKTPAAQQNRASTTATDPFNKAEPAENTAQTGKTPLPLLMATAAGGAVGGLALAYGLALSGLWPAQTDAEDVDNQLTQIDSRLSGLESAEPQPDPALDAVTERLDALEIALSASTEARDTQLAQWSAFGATAPEQLADLDQRLTDLSLRLDAVAAGASTADAEAISAQLGQLQGALAEITGRVDSLAQAAPTLDERLNALEAATARQPELEALQRQQQHSLALATALRALEEALASGAPFAVPLAELESVVPTLTLAPALRASASSGVPTARNLLAAYRTKLPELLAARPREGEPNWFDSLIGQAQSTLALRAAGDVEGTGPDALIARGEAALERGDVAAALAVFATMPVPMQAVLDEISTSAQLRVDLEALIAQARQGGAAGTEGQP